MRGVELFELQRTEDRLDMIVDEVGIAIIGTLPDRAEYRPFKPYVEVFAEGPVLVVVHDPYRATVLRAESGTA